MNPIIKIISLLIIVILAAPYFVPTVSAGDRVVVKPNAAKRFATMPGNAPFPEGIAVNPNNGNVIVGTFIFGADNHLVRFSKKGRLLANVNLGAAPLLGLAYNPDDGKVYICRPTALIGAPPSLIQRIAANFVDDSSLEIVAAVPSVGAPAAREVGNPDGSMDMITFGNNAAVPNAITFSDNGDLYFADSLQGAVFRIADPAGICPSAPCALMVETIAHSPLLATAGFPPFGANGVALNDDETILFVTNTGDDRVLSIDLTKPVLDLDLDSGETKNVVTFAESINGADGILNDGHGRLWVIANQADQLVALDIETGRVRAELGEFLGIKKDGSVRGLLFPASLSFLSKKKVVITNVSLPLTGGDEEPEGDVEVYTISRINLPKL